MSPGSVTPVYLILVEPAIAVLSKGYGRLWHGSAPVSESLTAMFCPGRLLSWAGADSSGQVVLQLKLGPE